MRKPTLSLTILEERLNASDNVLRRYMLTKRGCLRLDQSIRTALELKAAKSLKAINPVSRLAYAIALAERLEAEWRRSRPTDIYFVTLVSGSHGTTLQAAPNFNIAHCRNWARRLFRGASYLGTVEAAYYYKAPFIPTASGAQISWHCHLLVWNISRDSMAKLKSATNESTVAFVPSAKAFHYRRLSIPKALERLIYMSKSSESEYTAYPRKAEYVDAETGEILSRVTGRWIPKKRAIRPGNLACATVAMGQRLLSEISFAGGVGSDVRSKALISARRRLVAAENARRLALRAEILGD